MEKFRNKYRIPSARLQTWDYGANASYFITICTHNREHYFGEIINGEMILNELGRIVETEWMKTIEIRPDMNLEFGEFVVMPNHFHAIIIIGENKFNTHRDPQCSTDAMHCVSQSKDAMHRDTQSSDTMHRDAQCSTDAMHRVSSDAQSKDAMHRVSTKPINKFGPQSKNLASIMRGFKSSITTYSIKNGMNYFAWQTRFYDHIIRDSAEFERIQNYIANNPMNWDSDKFHNHNG